MAAKSYPTKAYRLITAAELADIEATGEYRGSAVDHKDGFLHMWVKRARRGVLFYTHRQDARA